MYRYFCVLFFLGLLLAACNRSDPPVYTPITEPTLQAGDAIPTPTENSILTVSGLIGMTNQNGNIVMDMPTIEALGLVEYSVIDPFKDEEITYTGVLMADLLDLWQVDEQAATLHMVALNDYQVDIPLQLIREYPVIFALQADGEYMPVADKGPAMLVWPYDHFEFERPLSDSYWIWQIKAIDVR